MDPEGAEDGPSLKRARREDPPPAADGSPFDRLPDEMLELLVSYLPTPAKFDLKLVSHRWREVILRCHPHQVDLRRFNSPEGHRNAIDNILPTMPWLHGLRGLNFRDIEAVQKNCEQLKALEVLVTKKTDPRDVQLLATGFPLLQEVTLPRYTTDVEVEILLDHKPNLRKPVLFSY